MSKKEIYFSVSHHPTWVLDDVIYNFIKERKKTLKGNNKSVEEQIKKDVQEWIKNPDCPVVFGHYKVLPGIVRVSDRQRLIPNNRGRYSLIYEPNYKKDGLTIIPFREVSPHWPITLTQEFFSAVFGRKIESCKIHIPCRGEKAVEEEIRRIFQEKGVGLPDMSFPNSVNGLVELYLRKIGIDLSKTPSNNPVKELSARTMLNEECIERILENLSSMNNPYLLEKKVYNFWGLLFLFETWSGSFKDFVARFELL